MLGGFSFCGVDINSLGLSYAPSLQDTFVFKESQYSTVEETFQSHKGGYFYGTNVQPKTFVLRCFFEDNHVNKGVLDKIGWVFSRGKTGRLVFKKRDGIWYNATVTNVDYSGLTNYMNGFVTITMKAYYPFGRTDKIYYSDYADRFQLDVSRLGIGVLFDKQFLAKSNEDATDMFLNSALLPFNMTPSSTIAQQSNHLRQSKEFILHNGGNTSAAVAVHISGDVGNGVQIINKTTGQKCRIVGLTKSITDDVSKYLVCDALNGKTVLTNGTQSQMKFLYHDGGYIELAPAYPIKRNIIVQTVQNSDIVTTFDSFDFYDVGRYIYLNNEWVKIIQYINENTIRVNKNIERQQDVTTCIVTMNELQIRTIVQDDDIDLSKLVFEYLPTFK